MDNFNPRAFSRLQIHMPIPLRRNSVGATVGRPPSKIRTPIPSAVISTVGRNPPNEVRKVPTGDLSRSFEMTPFNTPSQGCRCPFCHYEESQG